jgi:hypothetical protein
VALGYCQLLRLSAGDFHRLMRADAELHRGIRTTAGQRLEGGPGLEQSPGPEQSPGLEASPRLEGNPVD